MIDDLKNYKAPRLFPLMSGYTLGRILLAVLLVILILERFP